jgi:DNA recombination protein RmuC
VALLRTLAYGWRQQVLAENAEAIRRTGEEMYDRLLTFSEHMSRVGRSLTGSVDAFNKAVGSFDNRVLPSVRRFTEMGVRAKREVENLSQIETLPRTVESDVEARTENA